MNGLASIWKKLISVVVVILLIMMVLLERNNTSKFLDEINQQARACKRHSESLATQLTVLNAHKKKLDEALQIQQIQTNEAVHDLNSKLSNILEEKKELTKKYELCQKSKIIPFENQNFTELTEKNEKQKKEIMALRSEIEKLKASIQNPVENAQDEKEEEVPQIHPPEEHKGYADGDTVHFHRKNPNSADLEFRRKNDPPAIPQIFSKNDLLKKIEKNKKLREEIKKEKMAENEDVIDFQQNRKPDRLEQDYKEME